MFNIILVNTYYTISYKKLMGGGVKDEKVIWDELGSIFFGAYSHNS